MPEPQALYVVEGPSTHVVTIKTEKQDFHFPAWVADENYLIADLRLFPHWQPGDPPLLSSRDLVFQPDELRRLEVPEHYIKAATESVPIPGFILVPRKKA